MIAQGDQVCGGERPGAYGSSKEASDLAWRLREGLPGGVGGDCKFIVSLLANDRKGNSDGSGLRDKSEVELALPLLPRHHVLQWGAVEGPLEVLYPDSVELRDGGGEL